MLFSLWGTKSKKKPLPPPPKKKIKNYHDRKSTGNMLAYSFDLSITATKNPIMRVSNIELPAQLFMRIIALLGSYPLLTHTVAIAQILYLITQKLIVTLICQRVF